METDLENTTYFLQDTVITRIILIICICICIEGEGGGSDSGRVCGQEGLDGSVLTGRSQSGPLCWGPRQPGGGEEGGEQAAVSQSDTATLSWSLPDLPPHPLQSDGISARQYP